MVVAVPPLRESQGYTRPARIPDTYPRKDGHAIARFLIIFFLDLWRQILLTLFFLFVFLVPNRARSTPSGYED